MLGLVWRNSPLTSFSDLPLGSGRGYLTHEDVLVPQSLGWSLFLVELRTARPPNLSAVRRKHEDELVWLVCDCHLNGDRGCMPNLGTRSRNQ